jgi:hypothetical protein
MNHRHFLVFLAWTFVVLALTGFLLFMMTLGDCAGDLACRSGANQRTFIVLAGGFILYWTIAALLFRRWAR